MSKVDSRYHDVREEIKRLPEAPSNNPVKDVVDLCDLLMNDIKRYTRPETGYESLIQENNEVFERFKGNIWSTRLLFTVDERDSKDKVRRKLSVLKEYQQFNLNDMHDFIEGYVPRSFDICI